jgi:hypothetical protein
MGGNDADHAALDLTRASMSLAAPFHVLAFAPLAVWLLGCGGAPAKPPLMANMVREDVSVEQLRAIDYEYASRFGQIVAACVLEIVDQSDDLRVLDRAYRWRMWAAAEARAAASIRIRLQGCSSFGRWPGSSFNTLPKRPARTRLPINRSARSQLPASSSRWFEMTRQAS